MHLPCRNHCARSLRFADRSRTIPSEAANLLTLHFGGLACVLKAYIVRLLSGQCSSRIWGRGGGRWSTGAGMPKLFRGCHPVKYPILEDTKVGSQRSVSQPQSVLTLTPNSAAICFLVFRNFSRFCIIFWPRVTGVSIDKKATNGGSLPLGLPSAGLANGS